MEDTHAEADKTKADQGILPSAVSAKGVEDQQIAKANQANSAAKGPNAADRAWQRICEKSRNAWAFIKAPESTNVAIAAATIVIAVATVYTYLEVHGGSVQTDKIIAANQRIATAMETAVGQAGTAIQASIDASRNDQRAWFGIKEITLANPLVLGKPVQISIMGLNTGKTPALDLSATEIRVGPSETERNRDFVIHTPDREVVAPNNTDVFYATVTYSDDSIRAIMAGTIHIYVRGELKYRDVFGLSHTTTFCAYYPTNGPPSVSGHFFNCKSGNSMN